MRCRVFLCGCPCHAAGAMATDPLFAKKPPRMLHSVRASRYDVLAFGEKCAGVGHATKHTGLQYRAAAGSMGGRLGKPLERRQIQQNKGGSRMAWTLWMVLIIMTFQIVMTVMKELNAHSPYYTSRLTRVKETLEMDTEMKVAVNFLTSFLYSMKNNNVTCDDIMQFDISIRTCRMTLTEIRRIVYRKMYRNKNQHRQTEAPA